MRTGFVSRENYRLISKENYRARAKKKSQRFRTRQPVLFPEKTTVSETQRKLSRAREKKIATI